MPEPFTKPDTKELLNQIQSSSADIASKAIRRLERSTPSLNYMCFKKINIQGADLSHSTLIGTNLIGSDLRRVNFSCAILSNTELTNANLLLAQFEGGKRDKHSEEVWSVCFSPDGKYLASSSADMTIKIWGLKSMSVIGTLHGHSKKVNSICFSPDSSRILSGGDDSLVGVWEMASMAPHFLHGHQSGITKVKSSSEYFASTSYDCSVILWDSYLFNIISKFQINSPIESVSFQGEIIVTAGWDGLIYFWDTKSQNLSRKLGYYLNALHSTDTSGLFLATGCKDTTALVYEFDSGKLRHRLRGHSSWITEVMFSPDTANLITTGRDQKAILWDVETGRFLTSMHHSGPLESVDFTADGRFVATCSLDSNIRIWKIPRHFRP